MGSSPQTSSGSEVSSMSAQSSLGPLEEQREHILRHSSVLDPQLFEFCPNMPWFYAQNTNFGALGCRMTFC